MLSSSCGSLSLEQIDRACCTRVPIRCLWFCRPKEYQHVYCPAKVSLQYMDMKNSDSAFSTRMPKNESLLLALKVKQGCKKFSAERKLSQSDSFLKMVKMSST